MCGRENEVIGYMIVKKGDSRAEICLFVLRKSMSVHAP